MLNASVLNYFMNVIHYATPVKQRGAVWNSVDRTCDTFAHGLTVPHLEGWVKFFVRQYRTSLFLIWLNTARSAQLLIAGSMRQMVAKPLRGVEVYLCALQYRLFADSAGCVSCDDS